MPRGNFSDVAGSLRTPQALSATAFYRRRRRVQSGGEGGIRTPGTLIRGTHDFQSCTFNRSVTSPCRDFKHLSRSPYPPESAMSPKCLHAVLWGQFKQQKNMLLTGSSRKYHGQKRMPTEHPGPPRLNDGASTKLNGFQR